jgi:hypothetical protein
MTYADRMTLPLLPQPPLPRTDQGQQQFAGGDFAHLAHSSRTLDIRRHIMLRVASNWLVVCILSIGLFGCFAGDMLGGSSISASIPAEIYDQDAAMYREFFMPEAVKDCINYKRGSGNRRSCRDKITYARMRYADLLYEQFRRRLFFGINGGNAAVDIAVLGLNSAGALVGGATTKAILAAISGGLVGTRGIVEKELLYHSAIQTLILKMDTDRAAVRVRITAALKNDDLTYPFEAAELDAGDYFRAGTLGNALIGLQGDSATDLTIEKSRINRPQAPPALWSPSAASEERAPVAPPPGRTAAPPPVPADARAVLPNTTEARTFLTAVAKLPRNASGRLTPESEAKVNRCTRPFGLPPLSSVPISDIRDQAGSNLPSIVACLTP